MDLKVASFSSPLPLALDPMALTVCFAVNEPHPQAKALYGLRAVAEWLGVKADDPDLRNVASLPVSRNYEVVNTNIQRSGWFGQREHPAARPVGKEEWRACWVSTRDGNSFYIYRPVAPVA